MTANPFAALLDGAVARGWCHPANAHKQMDPDLAQAITSEVLAALAAAMDPAIVERAGNLLPDLQKAMVPYDPEVDAQEYWETLCSRSVDLITALLVQNAAQEAQIKGLEAERDKAMEWAKKQHGCADLYADALAAMTKERDELRASIAWVDEVYPERIEAGGAGIQITWGEFNAMQAAIGVTVDKRIGGPEGKAVHNHRLRTALAAERAKVAKLVEAGKLARESIASFMQETNRTAESGAGDILAQLDAAITEAGQ